MAAPDGTRANLPDGYGLKADSKVIEWSEVDARLRDSMHYWICTVSPASTPVVRPIDGMWLDERLWFGGDPASRWKRNLAANQATSVHLEDGDRAVIAEGVVSTIRLDRAISERLVADSNRKYAMGQTVDDYDGQEIDVFAPSVVFAWNLLYEDATRFDFPA
jgi:hypothetical protein